MQLPQVRTCAWWDEGHPTAELGVITWHRHSGSSLEGGPQTIPPQAPAACHGALRHHYVIHIYNTFNSGCYLCHEYTNLPITISKNYIQIKINIYSELRRLLARKTVYLRQSTVYCWWNHQPIPRLETERERERQRERERERERWLIIVLPITASLPYIKVRFPSSSSLMSVATSLSANTTHPNDQATGYRAQSPLPLSLWSKLEVRWPLHVEEKIRSSGEDPVLASDNN